MAANIFHNITHNNNMGIVRYILCLSVIVMHTKELTGIDIPLIMNGTIAVGGFFALSGFLLFSSFQKKPRMHHYFSKRARRILPPYFLIVILCALGLSAVSTLPPAEYFTSGSFYKYLLANLSFLNFLHPELPGVFTGGEFVSPVVNGSLWTMKGEWACYSLVPIFFWLIGNNRKRGVFSFATTVIVSLAIAYILYGLYDQTGSGIYATLGKQFRSLIPYFFCGALINLIYNKFLKYKWWVIAGTLALIATADVNPIYYTFLQPIAVSCAVIWFSQVGKWGTFLKNHDDLSYDMYLFHFPIIQLTNHFGLQATMTPYALVGLIIATSFVGALLSWNTVGKHILRRRPATSDSAERG